MIVPRGFVQYQYVPVGNDKAETAKLEIVAHHYPTSPCQSKRIVEKPNKFTALKAYNGSITHLTTSADKPDTSTGM